MDQEPLRTAIYLRYSSKEDRSMESGSIQSQRDMLRRYIERHGELALWGEYVDDDYTGSNFNRPGFLRMREDCRSGGVQCILVKDHSRFGRNSSKMQLILTEELEHIRYISKDDHFDSRYDDYDVIFQFKNLVNEMYAQDISKKVHSSIDDKQAAGRFTGSFAAYGYRKSPEDKNALIIDEEAADVVRRIYRMRMEGINIAAIARRLNDDGILSPLDYKLRQGYNYYNPTAKITGERHLWGFSSVSRILTMQTYAGDLVQGRRRQKMRRKPRPKDKSEWVVAYDSVPPIVSREDFETVRRLMDSAGHQRLTPGAQRHPFAGLLRCGECGKALVKSRKSPEALYFVCGSRKRGGKRVCGLEYIRYDILEKIILDDANALVKEAGNAGAMDGPGLWEAWEDTGRSTLEKLKREQKNQEAKRRGYYRDYTEGLITKEDYLWVKSESESRERRLEEEIRGLREAVENQSGDGVPWLRSLKHTGRFDELDPITAQEMISSVTVYKGLRIEITYTFDEFAYVDEP